VKLLVDESLSATVARALVKSVILLRRAPHRPAEQASLLLAVLGDIEDDIDAGAVVVLGSGRARIRRLPI
jgi:hypothetical protein